MALANESLIYIKKTFVHNLADRQNKQSKQKVQ